MDILLNGIYDIWRKSILFVVVRGKATSLDKLIDFNDEYKNK